MSNDLLVETAIIAMASVLTIKFQKFEDKLKFVIEDNRWLEKEYGIKIDNFRPPKIYAEEWYRQDDGEHTFEIWNWIVEKIESRKRLLQEIREKQSIRSSPLQPELEKLFNDVESRIPSNKKQWEIYGGHIRLAAFCELLYEKKYFTIKGRINACCAFALYWKGIDIRASLNSRHKPRREALKKTYLPYFK